MTNTFLYLLLLLASLNDIETGLQATPFNEGWKCQIGDALIDVDLPHTPRIEPLVVNDQWQGKLVYSKEFQVSEKQAGKTLLHFEGVMHETMVKLNGRAIKSHVGGYLPFSVDLTPYLQKGPNRIQLEVINTDNSKIPPGKPLEGLDFNYYGGIYRDVWLISKNDIRITDPFLANRPEAGWLVHFEEISEKQATGSLWVEVENGSKKDASLTIEARLHYKDQDLSFSESIFLSAAEQKRVALDLLVENPSLWSVTDPALYELTLEVRVENGKVLDKTEDKIGIRQIALNEDGFYLNGQKMFIRGTNRHQEYPYVGYAISNNANFRDALKIKNAGFDFVRLSHYPQDESFLRACDELGILVMNAIPGWQYYGEGEFVDNSIQDIRDMVRRDRNHPSVVFWEVSLNESQMTEEYMIKANETLDTELPFNDTYSAGWIDHESYDLYIPARQHTRPPHYLNFYKQGKRPVLIAEYGDWEYYAHNAGFNQTAFEDLTDEERTSRQLRAHGEQRLLQQAFNFQEASNSNRRGIGTIGHANWLMFDYNRGYADDLEASGIADIFRIPKFAYYFYQSQRPWDETVAHPLVQQGPMVKLATYWTEASSLNVRVFSNCEEVELYLNDQLVGRQQPLINEFSDHLINPPFEFRVAQFEAGKLSAIGLIDGQQVARDVIYSPGEAADLRMGLDTVGGFDREADDLFFIHAEVIDQKGTCVPSDTSQVLFTLHGAGELIGENPIRAEAGVASILFRGSETDLQKIRVHR